MGLAKFNGYRTSNGQPVSWDRAHVDGVPFRGRMPLMREEEYTQRVEREVDGHIATFQLWDPEQKKACEAVLDHIANEWWRLIDRDKQYVPEHKDWVVMIMWTEPYNTIRAKPGELSNPGSLT